MRASIVDTVLDRTVVGGYSKVGYAVRSRSWDAGELQRMDGKVVLVTGATSGLGLAAAQGFAELGANVWLLVRDRDRGEQARAAVAQRCSGGEARLAVCDLAELSSVRAFALGWRAEVPGLDVLVHNAGVLANQRTLSPDGIELTFAVNVLAPFLLTKLLLGSLEGNAPSRIINVSSGGMYAQRLRADDLEYERGEFNGTTAYARSKRAEVILTEMWAQRMRGTGVTVHAMHPGWADTPGVRSSLPRFHQVMGRWLRTAEQGADTIVWLGAAAAPGGSSGGFWHDRRRRPTYLTPWTRESSTDRERLWRECERLTARQSDD